MKNLNKLQIHNGKAIKDGELKSLRGGVVTNSTSILCYSEGWITGCMGYLGTVQGDCNNWQKECKDGGFTAYCAEC